MDLMSLIVKYILTTNFEDIPPEIVDVTKKTVIDTLGVIIAGSSVEGTKLLMEFVRDFKGMQECTVAVFGDKVPASLAAQVNGAMARAREIDDVSDVRPLHISASVIPVCLAIAEKQGSITGKQFVAAVALGQDLAIRFSLATITSPVVSGRYNLAKVFACTGAAGKLLGLGEDQLWNAMGIAYSQMPGDMQALSDGVMTAYITQGTRAKAAIEAALMARKGITGTRNVLLGQYGFFNAFEPDPDLDALTSGLGSRFAGRDIAIKLYSACRFTHQSIELAQNFVREGLRPENIDRITVRCGAECYRLVGQPLEDKRRPRSYVDGNFSIPFTVAVAFTQGDVFIGQVNDDTIRDPGILEIADRVTPVIDPEREVAGQVVGSVVMEITTKDGRTLTKETMFPKGNPKNPASMDDCVAKFRKATAYSRTPFPHSQLDKIVNMVHTLEKLANVNELVALLAPQSDKPIAQAG